MRKIETAAEKEKRSRRNQVIVGVVLVSLMILSTVGYAIEGALGNSNANSGNQKVTYNGIEFINKNGVWTAGNFGFQYNPKQTPDLGLGIDSADKYKDKPLYIQSENVDAKNEIALNLGRMASRVVLACLENSTNCPQEYPTKNCNDNFIIIKIGDANTITQKDGCVYIEAPDSDIVKISDQFLFKTLGIK